MKIENYSNIDSMIDELCKAFHKAIKDGETKGNILKYIIVKIFSKLWPGTDIKDFSEFNGAVHEAAIVSHLIYFNRIQETLGKPKKIKEKRCQSEFFNLVKE